MTRLRVGILFGGRSEEHPVSVKSAREVAANLDPGRYEPVWIGIATDGSWRLCDGPSADLDAPGSPSGVLSPDPAVRGLLVFDEGRFETIPLDLVFPVLHGRFGEDGAVQGLLELSGIPYVGCGVAASALAMDKALTYAVVRDAGILTPTHWILGPGDVAPPGLPYPLFAKPARRARRSGSRRSPHRTSSRMPSRSRGATTPRCSSRRQSSASRSDARSWATTPTS